ncbi:response regulator transcription factor [Oculatella sp. FACHB-28]|uniref:response regulator transcription factor n=1 Tax=Cyanophyceae TaxID=3028117 RepID=UPI00168891DF|nr:MULTISPECIES: response regulator transcription factor [Cyanophyceae]MBD1999209.1 response regulator transcription factor [Leptolyngbya sp. FACHB-541]MBD2056744.1 response regulator transcription factor [Oculatella sp. FACHB-28]
MIRVMLVDDQPLFREGLAFLLSQQTDLEVIAEANHGSEAIALCHELQPDVILMDIQMPICDGVEATREIHRRYPWIRILVLTTFDHDSYIWQSLQAGALGYLLKNTPAQQMADAIRKIQQGYGQLGPTIAPKVFAQGPISTPQNSLVSADAMSVSLNPRERDLLIQLAQGSSNREIAQSLQVTEGTVKNYLTRIFSKLGVRDRIQAALWAQKHLESIVSRQSSKEDQSVGNG